VGKGNRRWYWLFLAAGTLFCLLYFLTAKYVQHWHSCADNATVTSTFVSACWLLLHAVYPPVLSLN
jgi:hypothetical protein